MAQRRMFSPQIVESEEFLSLPATSQTLYFHLGMHADDDGFIQPRIVMRTLGSAEDDLKVLLAKRFLLPFESGVVVIKHWLIHNLIQKDRYHPTRFQEEKKTLFIKENKAYTDSVNKMLPEVRLDQERETPAIAGPILVVKDEIKPKTEKHTIQVYNKLLKWAENERGFKFMTGSITKQYAALKEANKNGLKPYQLQERWEEMAADTFWETKGFDWMDVVKSFNKRPA